MLAKLLEQRPSRWGVFLIACWSVILTIQSLASLLLLSASVIYIDNQFQVWIVFLLGVGFSIIFGLSAYGLWREFSWGRTLFLWAVVSWSLANLLAIIIPNPLAASRPSTLINWLLAILPYAVSLIVPLWYLNRQDVKQLFQ